MGPRVTVAAFAISAIQIQQSEPMNGWGEYEVELPVMGVGTPCTSPVAGAANKRPPPLC